MKYNNLLVKINKFEKLIYELSSFSQYEPLNDNEYFEIDKKLKRNNIDNNLRNGTKNEIMNWINEYMPKIILKYIYDAKTLKACGKVSNIIVDYLNQSGYNAEVITSPGHYLVIVPLQNGNNLEIDATYKQFDFLEGCGLLDFNREDRENPTSEYHKLMKLFKQIKHDPMSIVRITENTISPI
jgi:hypothetical protein